MMGRAASTLALATGMIVSLAPLGGCRVGPKYVAPTPPAPPAFKEATPDAYKDAPPGTWQPAKPEDAMLKGKWWETFQEPELNALEEQLNINNNNIAEFFQNFMAARAQVRQAKAQFWPTLSTDPSYTRTKSPSALQNAGLASTTGTGGAGSAGGSGSGTTTSTGTTTTSGRTSTVISLPFDVSWEPDIWGKVRNTVSEFANAAQVSAATLENERLTEQASLAEFYFQLRGQDALQDIYNQTVDADRKSLELTRTLVDTGIDSPESVAQAEVTLDNAEEQASGIAQNRAIYEHAIATLIGKAASDFSMPVKPLTTPVPSIPIGVPSQMLQRRPDVAAAERTMAEANALIGVEKAAYYPTLDLVGSGGLEASHISSLFSIPALAWSAGASASETIFDGGLRRATLDQYKSQYNADASAYKQTVLTAFQQVEDYIATLRVTSGQIRQQDTAVKAAQRYVDIATSRYETGLDPYLNVVSAETTLLGDQQTAVTLRVNEMTAAVELVQALGGGWDVTQLPSERAITTAAAADQVRNTP
jgi:NodT family efflux transporter outer membrane factor (OMF) lipoprotein